LKPSISKKCLERLRSFFSMTCFRSSTSNAKKDSLNCFRRNRCLSPRRIWIFDVKTPRFGMSRMDSSWSLFNLFGDFLGQFLFQKAWNHFVLLRAFENTVESFDGLRKRFGFYLFSFFQGRGKSDSDVQIRNVVGKVGQGGN